MVISRAREAYKSPVTSLLLQERKLSFRLCLCSAIYRKFSENQKEVELENYP